MSNSENTKLGYDKEEEFFYKLNRDLIEKKRVELDRDRKANQKTQSQAPHWLTCPKCGSDLKEIELLGIKIDRCAGCQGTFLDRGELELLIEAKEHTGFFKRLKEIVLR